MSVSISIDPFACDASDEPFASSSDVNVDPQPRTLIVRPWVDPVLGPEGHSPHSRYVELFWLSVLGPTSTWLLRRLTDGFEDYPDGYVLDLEQTAKALGVPGSQAKASPFHKAVARCTMFGMAHRNNDLLSVRSSIPWLETRHLARLPAHLKEAHRDWERRQHPAQLRQERRRAEAVADALAWAGDDERTIERRLVLMGTSSQIAQHAAVGATRRAGAVRTQAS